uniref:Chitin synthase export chaperone n=1 Tax=Ganoderma boninense TaxID=34458 RepID=A0A5K1K6S8_9APHY|nr:Chitin synthase export chaperone [Ganoderma boninense]
MFSVRNVARRLAALVSPGPPRPPSPPRAPSTATFLTIDPSQPIEEETLPHYDPNNFYPVRMGEVFQARYQVVGKLGYGAYSTVWLCRDLVGHRYVTVKVCTRNAIPVKRELAALEHLNRLPWTMHGGRPHIRTLLDQFVLTFTSAEGPPASSVSETPGSESAPGPQSFQCLVHKPMLMSISALRDFLRGNKLDEQLAKLVLIHVLTALDYLHSKAKLIHTDINEHNILLDLDDAPTLAAFEEAERTDPLPRKDAGGGRTIYLSRALETAPEHYGKPVLCDFGEARIGLATKHTGLIQPDQYRAPEVVLGVPWDEKVDIWTVGVLIWDMFEGKNMFRPYGGPEDKRDDLYHLAHMVALLGPPPADFLARCTMAELGQFFDKQGKETLSETILEGEDKALFLAFVRKMVRWDPGERASAKELLRDPWLNTFKPRQS